MADPRRSDEFTRGILVGFALAGGDDWEGDEWYFLLREVFRDEPMPLHLERFLRRRPRHRVAHLESRIADLEARLGVLAPAVGGFAWSLSTGARPDDMDQLPAVAVRLYLELAGSYPDGVVTAATRFVEALGFDVLAVGPPERGSFRQKLVMYIKGFFSRPQTQDALEKGTRAIEIQLLDRPQAEATKALAEAAAGLLGAVNSQKGAVCLQVGSLLLVRYKPDGKKEYTTVVRTLSAVQLRRLEENQARLDEPNTILAWLGLRGGDRTLPSPDEA